MSSTDVKPRVPVVVGCAFAVLHVAVALSCMLATSSAHYLLTAAPTRTRTIGLIPYAVLAVGLLAVGLIARRWWQAPLAPVVLMAGGFWWSTWVMNLPTHTVEHDWTAAHAADVVNRLGGTWDVVAGIVVIGGWGLVRREGWWWALGLFPSAVLVAVAEVVVSAFAPGPVSVGDGGIEAAARSLSHVFRVHQAIAIVVSTLVVVGGVWLCVLVEKYLAPAFRPNAVGTQPRPTAPVHPPFVFAAPPSVADEIRKLADLRAAGELTDAEFEVQKSRLLG